MTNALTFSTPRGFRTPDMTIAWETQPSLQHLVVRSESLFQDAATWAETMPLPFDAWLEPAPFFEPFAGLIMRDIDEPEIFRALFGDTHGAG